MRGAGRLPVSAGVSPPVTTWSMTISRPRAQSASSAARMAADVDGLPSSGTYRRLRPATGRMPGRTSSTGATWLFSSASATWPMPAAGPGAHEQLSPKANASTSLPPPTSRVSDSTGSPSMALSSSPSRSALPGSGRSGSRTCTARIVPAGRGREGARRGDQLPVGLGVCYGYEKRHPASTCQGPPPRRRSWWRPGGNSRSAPSS